MIRFFLLVLACAAAHAADAFTPQRLKEASAAIRTIRCAFTQEKKLAMFDQPVIAKGEMEISRPLGAIRWEFTGRSLLILKDGRLRRWGADGKEEHGNDPSLQSMIGQMKTLLTGDLSAMDNLFTVSADSAGEPVILLKPKESGLERYVQRIELRFRPDLSAPESLRLVAAGGDETLYKFDDPEIGPDLPAARFSGP